MSDQQVTGFLILALIVVFGLGALRHYQPKEICDYEPEVQQQTDTFTP